MKVTYEEYHDHDWFNNDGVRNNTWWLHRRIEKEVYSLDYHNSQYARNKINKIVRELK